MVCSNLGCGEASNPLRSRFRNALRAGAFRKRSEARFRSCKNAPCFSGAFQKALGERSLPERFRRIKNASEAFFKRRKHSGSECSRALPETGNASRRAQNFLSEKIVFFYNRGGGF